MKQKDTQSIDRAEQEAAQPAEGTEQQVIQHEDRTEQEVIQHADGAEQQNVQHADTAEQEAVQYADGSEQEALQHADNIVEQKTQSAEGTEQETAQSVNGVEIPSLELLESELKKAQYKRNYSRVLKSTVFSLMVVAAAAVLIAVLLLPVLQISGTSMTDTLQNEDIVVAVNSSKFKTGDVVAFYYNNNILIKRVIANPGDWVNIDEEGNVYVNDVKLDEPYVKELAFGECDIELPYQVPDKKCFVMGDHRATSIDSRNSAVGCVSTDAVVGKILFRVWPLSEIGIIK